LERTVLPSTTLVNVRFLSEATVVTSMDDDVIDDIEDEVVEDEEEFE